MPTPKKHAEIIKAWADGAPIEWRAGQDYEWVAISEWPGWDDKREYRIKPAAPKWPQTTMAEDSILSAWYNGNDVRGPSAEIWAMIRVANAAIAHSCETGSLVPADKVREIEAKAYEEGVKEGAERGLDKAIRATLNHVNFAVDGIGWMKIRSEAKK